MRRSLSRLALLGAAFAMLGSTPSLAWGPDAHRVVALIAERVLQQSDPAALKKLNALLATDKSHATRTDIASEATWADVLRDKSEEARSATTPWHAVRLNAQNPDLSAACFGRQPLPEGYPASHGPRENCAVDKVLQFRKELANPETTSFERVAAVQYLLNLVADLNDPLLAIDHGDQGGNCVAVQIGGKPPVRLATYWETTLPAEVIGANPIQAAGKLAAAPADAKSGAAGDPESWAKDSFEVAKSVTYGFASTPGSNADVPMPKGESLSCASVPVYKADPDYETKAQAALRQQLTKAGLRLASVLSEGLK